MDLDKPQELVKNKGCLACCSPWGHKESDMTGQVIALFCFMLLSSKDNLKGVLLFFPLGNCATNNGTILNRIELACGGIYNSRTVIEWLLILCIHFVCVECGKQKQYFAHLSAPVFCFKKLRGCNRACSDTVGSSLQATFC